MDQITSTDVAARISALAKTLQAGGMLTDDRWRGIMHRVPRHLFVPPAGWAVPDSENGTAQRIDAVADQATWWDAVYSDTSIVIQSDDGATDPASGAGCFSSSVSAPGAVTQFLELLDIRDHDRVLDIGTGSGWTAALLCERVGAPNVTSVEVDPGVAAQAAANLKAAGYTPRLMTADGAGGCPDGAPYDRVHVTCGVTDIPLAWVTQVRPGGTIVLPWLPDGYRGCKLRLTVLDDGTAVGSFHGPAGYMMLRSQRRALVWNPHHGGQADVSSTMMDPRTIAYASAGAHLSISALAPGVAAQVKADGVGAFSLRLFEVGDPDGSWAGCYRLPGTEENEVRQYGARRLWDEVYDAYLRWVSWGSPGEDRFGMTVTPHGQYLWLGDPARPVAPTR